MTAIKCFELLILTLKLGPSLFRLKMSFMKVPIRKGAQRDGRCRNGQKGKEGRKERREEGGSAVPISGKGVPLFGQMTPLPPFLASDRLTYCSDYRAGRLKTVWVEFK